MAEAEAPLEVTPELAGEPFSRETTQITEGYSLAVAKYFPKSARWVGKP